MARTMSFQLTSSFLDVPLIRSPSSMACCVSLEESKIAVDPANPGKIEPLVMHQSCCYADQAMMPVPVDHGFNGSYASTSGRSRCGIAPATASQSRISWPPLPATASRSSYRA